MTTAKLHIENLLTFTVESGIILIVFYLFYHYLLKNDTTFQFNRFYLLISQSLAILLPVIAIPALTFPTSVPENAFYFQFPAVEVTSLVNSYDATFGLIHLIFLIYLAGFVFKLSKLVLQIISIRKLYVDNSYRKSFWKGNKIIYTNGELPTFTFYKTIFFNDKAGLTTEEAATILLHESIHIRELHTVDLLLSELLCTIFWFNPIAKLYKRAITLNHEYIADAKVLTDGQISNSFYKKILATSCLQSSNLNIGAYFFNKSETLNRINMMNSEPKRISKLKLICLITIAGLLTFTFSCETNEEKIAQEPAVQTNNNTAPNEKAIIITDEIFSVVETPPSFKGKGNAFFMEYVGRNLKYPSEDIEKQTEGKVYVQFVIEKDGAITNVEVVSNKGSEKMADEAIRVIENSPRWEPGRQNENPVRVRMVMPITFKLS